MSDKPGGSTIATRWAAKEEAAHVETPEFRSRIEAQIDKPKYRHYKPFVEAVGVYVNEARDGERIYFGVDEFDAQIRGIGRGQLCIINGFSHSAKTLLLAHILRHNQDKRVALFTPDEPAQLVLAKLASAHFGVPADEIEDRVTNGDQEAVELLRRTALEAYPNLAVFDKPLRGEDMDVALGEAELVWGGKAQLVCLDYLELLQAGDTVPAKGEFVKAFTSRHEVPFILVHQSSRTSGSDGKAQGISAGAYGGEQLATFQLGVWRKKAALAAQLIEVNDRIVRAANGATQAMLDKKEELEHELQRAEFTVTVAITKNKRPGRREGREEIDFELFGATGLIAPLPEGDLPTQYRQRLAASRQSHNPEGSHAVSSIVSPDMPITSDQWGQPPLSDDEFYEEREQW